MANQEHLDILKQGVQEWNQWRKKYPNIQPNLSSADLRGTGLNGANLSSADLSSANLSYADLSSADLSDANLRGTLFGFTDLNRADLRSAYCGYTYLSSADFSKEARLSKVVHSDGRVGFTVFAGVDLSQVQGLDTVRHNGLSEISISTIYRSQGNIPEAFLRGAGIDDLFIVYIRSLIGKSIEYYSCFISYSSKDEAFAKRLYADLQSNGIRCWFVPEDLKWGERIHANIDEAIRLNDKLLLILSKYSVASEWVEHEVKSRLAKESKEKRVTLFPVRLDTAVLESSLPWATEIRHTRNIVDFTHWKNHDDYQKALSRLLRDLIAELPNELEPKQ